MAAAEEADSLPIEQPLPGCSIFDHGGGLREVSVVKAVEEYLSYHHLDKPLECFKQEVERVGLTSAPSVASTTVAENIDSVLGDFDVGRRPAFTVAWERIMPEDFRAGRDGRGLELRLQAHFATFRARKELQAGRELEAPQLQSDLEPFRDFLAQQGLDEVAGDEALMPLFALPFVQRPHVQPQVRIVFTAKWLQDLRRDIEAALLSQQPQFPLLYQLLEPPHPACQTDETAWRAVWAELFRVADASLDAALLAGHGVQIPAEFTKRGRRQLERLREKVPGGFELRLLSELPPGHGVMSPSRGVRQRAAGNVPPDMPRDLDFRRLAEFIRAAPEERERFVLGPSGPPPTLAAVLRALLQRLASAEGPVSQRRGFLMAVACFDVLGIRADQQTMPGLLADTSVAELALGILAVLACEPVGRTYVVEKLTCVEIVVRILMTQPLESSLHIQALAALQRLSLRRAPQDRIIDLGLVEWVLGVLGWQGESIQGMPSEFSLEFGSAMLMNLALRTKGKRKCMELDTLTIAMNLMEHWNSQIRTHINGTVYSLLSLPSFRAKARERGLDGMLRSIHAQADSLGDELSKSQIQYLLEQLSPPADAPVDDAAAEAAAGESGEDDEDDDENFLEEEELAGLILGDRGGKSAEEALRGFLLAHSPPGTAEAQFREFRAFVSRGCRL